MLQLKSATIMTNALKRFNNRLGDRYICTFAVLNQ